MKILSIIKGKIMNGAECNICGDCTHDECQCPNKLKQNKDIDNISEVIETVWNVFAIIPRWKLKIIRWIWPDILRAVESVKKYYDESATK